MQNNYYDNIADFDDGMPEALRKAVYSTEVYDRYLHERRRIGRMTYEWTENGKPRDDEEMIAEVAKLDKLCCELEAEIERCKLMMNVERI